jgi:SnoaL-like domain
VREYFTAYGYVQTYHLVGNIRVAFDGEDAADVKSYIDSNHWMADGRFLSAPIEYEDRFERVPGRGWRISERKIVVWRWWVTDGYAPDPTDPSLARPA